MNGAELALRFSWQPNSLCYCGPKIGPDVFSAYLQGDATAEDVKEVIKKFEGLYPYLSLIAKKLGKDILDPEVVLAYWLGSDIKPTRDDFKTLFDDLASRGLPKSLADTLLANLPEDALLTHAFHVLYVGPGNTTGTVEPTLSTKDMCLISPATVVSVGANLTITRSPLIFENDRLQFGKPQTFTAHYVPKLLPDVKPGDIVALHWGFACIVLNQSQETRLHSYNRKMIDMMNTHFTASS